MAADILIVDDEADIRDLVAGILDDEGFESRVAGTVDDAFEQIADRAPQLIILDIWLEGSRMDGLEMLDEIKVRCPDVPVIMISGHGTIDMAVSAINRGATEFVEKPFKVERLVLAVSRALELTRLRQENEELRTRTGAEGDLIGNSSAMNALRGAIEKVAPTGSRVLITGPAGSGKEVIARRIHALSPRSGGPFVVVSAASIEPERMELELFGEEPPATAGTRNRKIGLLERAHGGTLYLDEVADMPVQTQSKILRVLLDQTFERVGGTRSIHVDVRVLSSSSQDLQAAIDKGQFRSDLYHRLNVVPVQAPPLSRLREDVPVMARYFVQRAAEANGLSVREIDESAMAALQGYDWPGNIRQLRNVMEQLLIMAPGDNGTPVSADMLPAEINGAKVGEFNSENNAMIMALPLREAREIFEREYLLSQIERFGGNVTKTAAFVGMERSALHRKLKLLGVTTDRGRQN